MIGLDWRQPLDEGWRAVGDGHAVQGNLDPITLFAPLEVLEAAGEGDSARGRRHGRGTSSTWVTALCRRRRWRMCRRW